MRDEIMRRAGMAAVILAFSWAMTELACKPKPPEPTPAPTVAPTPTPAPTPCLPPPDGDWTAGTGDPDLELKLAVREAQAAIGDRCGHATADETEQQESLELLAAVLRDRGYCAGRMDDTVFIQRDDMQWEEHHAVYYRNGCWLSNTFRNIWAHP